MTVQKEKYTKIQTQSHKKHACRQTKDKKNSKLYLLEENQERSNARRFKTREGRGTLYIVVKRIKYFWCLKVYGKPSFISSSIK